MVCFFNAERRFSSQTTGAMSVITEGNVSKSVLSFTADEFLFAATVCKSWRCNSTGKYTNFMSVFQSASRMQEAIRSGVQTDYLFDMAVLLGAEVQVLEVIAGHETTDMLPVTMRYAAFFGRVDVVEYIENQKGYDYDEYDLFEAIRGGHMDVVKRVICRGVCPPINAIVEWPLLGLESNPSEDKNRLLSKSGTEGQLYLLRRRINLCDKCDVTCHQLGEFMNEEFYHSMEAMSCMELAIRKNRLDIVRVLREHGGEFEEDSDYPGSFSVALQLGNSEMLLYLKDAGCVIGEDTLYEYISHMYPEYEFDISIVEFVLQHRLVTIEEGCLSTAIYNGRMDLLELLLQHEAPVCDDHVDEAVAKRNFSLVDRLMRVHGCRPTPRAYEFVLTHGASEDSLHENGVGDIQEDAFYLQKLGWVHSTGCRLEFDSFAAMQSDWMWGLILSYFSEAVVNWFREHL